jgi:hypothetical protein
VAAVPAGDEKSTIRSGARFDVRAHGEGDFRVGVPGSGVV